MGGTTSTVGVVLTHGSAMRVYRAKRAVVVNMTLNTITLQIEGGSKQKIRSKLYELLLGDRCQVTIDARSGKIREVMKEGAHSVKWDEPMEEVPALDEYEKDLSAQELNHLESVETFEDWEWEWEVL